MKMAAKDKFRILCIEDNPDTLELMAEELQEAGYLVECAADGLSGLAALRQRRPDAVICDIDMPGLSGFEVLEKAAADGNLLGRVPFILLTAYDDRDSVLHGRRLGCDDYLTKPIDFELLVEVVRTRLMRVGKRDGDLPARLSEREAEALTWSARGKSSADIAVLMSLSERTINFHIENASAKLGVATRIQAAVKASLLGLIKP